MAQNANATAFEGATAGTPDDSLGWYSTNSNGQTFTTESNHTITSLDIKTTADTSAVGTLHFTAGTANLPTGSDLFTIPSITFPADTITNITIPCYALTSGTQYGFWLEWQSGGGVARLPAYSTDPYAGGDASHSYPSAGNTIPTHQNTGEDLYFQVYGDTGGCTTPINLGTSTAGTTTAQMIGGTSFGLAIIIVMLSIIMSAYIHSTLFRRKKITSPK